MVKRILALSLLMVCLSACGSGGGATAEFASLNATPEPTCQCSVYQLLVKNGGYTSPAINVSTELCNSENLHLSFGCANYTVLCNLLLKDWGSNNDGGAYTNINKNLSNLWVYCE